MNLFARPVLAVIGVLLFATIIAAIAYVLLSTAPHL